MRKQEKEGTRIQRRRFLGCSLATLSGTGAAIAAALLGLRVGGTALEKAADAKADAAFASFTQPLVSSAETVLTDSVIALQTAKPAITQFLNIVQMLQQIGTKEINGFLTELEHVPLINTTGLQKFTDAINTLLDTRENDLLTLLAGMEQSITGLKQHIAEAEQQAPLQIHHIVADEVHSIDFLAPPP